MLREKRMTKQKKEICLPFGKEITQSNSVLSCQLLFPDNKGSLKASYKVRQLKVLFLP